MKLVLLLVFTAAIASPQSTTNTFTKDLNGNRVEGPPFITTDGERTERYQSINGRMVPLDQSVDRVVREDANGKVTERIVRKFSPEGRLASTERVMIEESRQSGGNSSVRETTFRSDINGSFKEAERRTTLTRVEGSTTTANTVIDRPSMSGTFETVEKRSAITEGSAENQRTTESIYRSYGGGGFQEALRYVKTASKTKDKSSETTANYEPDMNGRLQLAAQSESTTTKLADGTEATQINLYAHTVAGMVQGTDSPMRVKEEQLVQRRVNPDGTVVETLSIRRPTVSDPNRLGDLQKLSETVCKGKCQPEAPKVAGEAARP